MRYGWILKGLAAFTGVNLLVAVPLCFILSTCLPQKFEVEVIGDGVVAIALSNAKRPDGTANCCASVELYDNWSDGHSVRVFHGLFPQGFDFSDSAFFVRSDSTNNLLIGSARMTFCGLFHRVLSPESIAAAYRVNGTNTLTIASNGMVVLPMGNGSCRILSCSRPSWGAWKFCPKVKELEPVFFAVAASLELLLLIVSMVVAFVRRGRPFEGFHAWQAVFLAVTATFFLFCPVPLQSYFANSADFPFAASRLLVDALPCALSAFAIAVSALVLTEIVFGRIAHFLVFAFLVYEYLEVGLLSLGAPPFIGDLGYYDDGWLMGRDIIVLEAVFMGAMALYVRLRRFFPWMVLALFVMSAAALLDSSLGRQAIWREPVDANYVCAREEVPFKVKYSSRKNVIVLVLDSVTSEAARDAALGDDHIASAFDGFTAYCGNLGTQFQTDTATVSMFTGETYKGKADKAQVSKFMAKAGERGSLLLDFIDSPYNVYSMAKASVYGQGLAKDIDEQPTAPIDGAVCENSLFWRPRGMLSMSVFNLSVFRMTPFVLKPLMFKWVCPFYGFAEEAYVYPEFRSAPVVDTAGTFLFCHTWGAHIPHDVSSDGSRHGPVGMSYTANLNHVRSVFSEVVKTLSAFNDKGIYDCSTVLVIADHGAHVKYDAKHFDPREDALPPVAFPMLWVKPANSHGPIVFDETTPTTHANLYKVLKNLKDRDMGAEEIASMLHADRRMFIRQTHDGYDEWIVKEDGAVESFTHHEVD